MTRMKSGLMVALAGVAIWAVSAGLNQAQTPAPAQPPPTRVAVVDIIHVFNQYKKTNALNELRQDHLTSLGKESDRRMTEIKALREERDAFAPNSKDWFTRNQKYRDMTFNYRVWEMTSQDDLLRIHMDWIERTYQDLTAEVKRLAEIRGFDLVITKEELESENVTDPKVLVRQILNRKVVFATPAVDLTEEVLRNVNEAFDKAGGKASLTFIQ